MTAVELDPVFVRALRLLHSKSKDSTSQLKSMLDEAIRHRKGLGPGPTGFGPASPIRKRDRDGNGVPRKDADKRYALCSMYCTCPRAGTLTLICACAAVQRVS